MLIGGKQEHLTWLATGPLFWFLEDFLFTISFLSVVGLSTTISSMFSSHSSSSSSSWTSNSSKTLIGVLSTLLISSLSSFGTSMDPEARERPFSSGEAELFLLTVAIECETEFVLVSTSDS